jgi:hypothetical protein
MEIDSLLYGDGIIGALIAVVSGYLGCRFLTRIRACGLSFLDIAVFGIEPQRTAKLQRDRAA